MKAGLSSAGKVVVITNHSDLKVTSGGELKPLAVIFSSSLLLGYLKNPESMQKPKYIVLLRRPDLFVCAVSQDESLTAVLPRACFCSTEEILRLILERGFLMSRYRKHQQRKDKTNQLKRSKALGCCWSTEVGGTLRC